MEKGDTLTQNREEDKPVELRVLRYFLAVARMQSISAAAEELHITQPTLSRQLMELEEELGAKLFDRGRKNRRVALTEAGKRLHRQAEEIVALADKTLRSFQAPQKEISGEIAIGGADVRSTPKEELMDTISFVFQNSRLLKGSILDNVRLGRPQATEAEVLAALKAAQCMDIVEKFPAGIHTVIGTKGVYLSGGEQQRIAIARAMLKNAPILILDEATAFADPDNEAKVQAAFAQLAKGKTVLMIAHHLSTVAIHNGISESGQRKYFLHDSGTCQRNTNHLQEAGS